MRKNTCQAVAIALLVLAVSGNGMAATSSKLAQIFDPEMIGADLAYLEQSTGPARNTHADTKVYKVEGCEVSATIGNGSVRALRLLLGPRCSFDLASFLPNYAGRLPPLQALTFGRFDAATGGDGRFHADCLSLCGTATDPTVLLHWSGSNADGGLEVMLEASQIDERVGAAAGDWTAAMEKNEDMDWIVDTRFNCTREYDALAHRLFRDIAVSAITIGHALPTPSCE